MVQRSWLVVLALFGATVGCGEQEWLPDGSGATMVRVDETMDPRAIAATVQAVERWNDALGSTVFVPWVGARRERCDEVLVEMRAFKDPDIKGHAVSDGCRSTVQLAPELLTFPELALEEVATHELGHVLGLQHDGDDDALSIMVPAMRARYPVVHEIRPDHVETVRQLIGL